MDTGKPPAWLRTQEVVALRPSAPQHIANFRKSACWSRDHSRGKAVPAPGLGKTPARIGAAFTSYLRMKQARSSPRSRIRRSAGKVDLPAIDMLIPSTWDFKGGVAGNTREGCFSDIRDVVGGPSPDGSSLFKARPTTAGNTRTIRQ